MTKLEEVEKRLRADSVFAEANVMWYDERNAIAEELDRLRAIIAKDERGTGPLRREIEEQRAELSSLKGEAERTVYCAAVDSENAVNTSCVWTNSKSLAAKHAARSGLAVFSVHISARKVDP